MEGKNNNSVILPPALRDHLTRQVRQQEAIFQSSNGRPMTEHDWMRLDEKAAASSSLSKGGGKCGRGNNRMTNKSMPGQLALLAWKKLRSAGWKRTMCTTTAHHKRRNSSDPILVAAAARYRPPEKKSKFERSIIQQVFCGREDDYLAQSKKKQRLKEAETEKIKEGVLRKHFRRRSAHLLKAAVDAAADIIVENENENHDLNSSKKTVIEPRRNLAAAMTMMVCGPAEEQPQVIHSDDPGTDTLPSSDDFSVMKGQQSLQQQQTFHQQKDSNLMHHKSRNCTLFDDQTRNNNNFASQADCVERTNDETMMTTSLDSNVPPPMHHHVNHLPLLDGGGAASERRPDVIPLLSAGDAVSAVHSAVPHLQSPALISSSSSGLGEGWGMRVSYAFLNTSIWKSVQDSAAMMGTEEDEPRAMGNMKNGAGERDEEVLVPNTAIAIDDASSSLKSGGKEQQQYHVRRRGGGISTTITSQQAISTNCDVQNKGGRNKVVSDNFVRMDLRKKGNFRFKRKKGGGKRKGGELMKSDWGNNCNTGMMSAWKEKQANDLEDRNDRQGCGDVMTARGNEVSQWQTERVEVGSSSQGGRGEDVLDRCIDMMIQQPEREETEYGATRDGQCDTYTKSQEVDAGAVDWEKQQQLTSPPLCSVHRKPARALKVKKAGDNRGRSFYVCNQPRGHQCNFFMWAEDVPFLIKKYLMQPRESSEEWLKRRSEALRKDITKKTVAEIKQELFAAGLPHGGGNKIHLIDRLMQHLENVIDDPSSSLTAKEANNNNNNMGDEETRFDNDYQGSCNSSSSVEEVWSSSEEELELLTVINRKEEVSGEEEPPPVSEQDCMVKQPISSAVGEGQTEAVTLASNDPYVTIDESAERRRHFRRKKADNQNDEVVDDLCNETGAEDRKTAKPQYTSAPSKILKEVFGHSSFRVGQEWAIHRILNGQSTLLVLATGSGKSLAYQLPALLLPGITVVVSPLISLMEDQLSHLPPQLPGACMSGSYSSFHDMARTLKELRDGRIKVLLLSPERLCSPSFQRLIALKGIFPEVSLLCVDEAHCVSQWSHNFRPAYMRIASALEGLHPHSVLGLTATASPSVISNICSILRISPGDSVMIGTWIRSNLAMNVSHCSGAEDKRGTLYSILAEGGGLEHGPCIVYVWLRRTAEALAEQLCSHGYKTVAYHGGMSLRDRKKAQTAFMKGRVRIIVATVAFGLGLNMKNVRGVVHFDMPTSIEGYVQEIGRAGRDGKKAYCHVLFSDDDFRLHHSLAHSNGLDFVQIRELLGMLFQKEKEVATSSSSRRTVWHVSVKLMDVCTRLDVREEVVETLLSLLEVASRKMVRLRGSVLDHCVVVFQKKKPSVLAEENAIIAAVCKVGVEVNNGGGGTPAAASASGCGYSHGCVHAGVINVVQALGGEFSPHNVMKELSRLRDEGEIKYSLSERSYHVTLDCYHGNKYWFDDEKLNVLSEALLNQMREAEALEARRVEEMYIVLSNSVITDDLSNGDMKMPGRRIGQNEKETSFLQDRITQYFQVQQHKQDQQQQQQQRKGDEENDNNSVAIELPHEEIAKHQSMLQRDAAILMNDPTFRGVVGNDGRTCPHAWILKDKAVLSRSISRFLHGIGSVAFPSLIWRQSHLWRRYVHLSFEDVLSVITSTLSDLEAKCEGKRSVTTEYDSLLG